MKSMGKNIRGKDVRSWLDTGQTQLLNEHWNHAEFQAYRRSMLEVKTCLVTGRNAWHEGVRNGESFVFLMDHDPEFRKAHAGMKDASKWWLQFTSIYRSSWALLDLAPSQLRGTNALDTLDLLMRVGCDASNQYMDDEHIREIRAKIHEDVQSFYERFQTQGALTAIAWMDNEHVWIWQRPRMANMMRHAASHSPNDVLGAYLVWACDAGCKSTEHAKQNKSENLVRMQQLRRLAERVGLDTSSYDEHAHQCKTLHDGLGMELNGQNILTYVQTTNMPAASIADGEDLGALFL